MTTRTQLIDQMPVWLKSQDATGDWVKFMAVLQDTLDTLFSIFDRYKEIGNPELVDSEAVVNAMLDGLGNPFDVSMLTVAQKKMLVMTLVSIYRKIGTDDSVRDVVRIFTEHVVTDIIRGSVTGWELGTHVIGDGINPLAFDEPLDFIVINPSAEFLIYSFMIDLDSAPTAAEETLIAKLMDIVKPAYMHYLGVHGFAPTPVYLHAEIGISELNLTFDLH